MNAYNCKTKSEQYSKKSGKWVYSCEQAWGTSLVDFTRVGPRVHAELQIYKTTVYKTN